MARRHRRRRAEGTRLGSASTSRVERHRGDDFYVRPVTGSAATRTYRCPGCQQPLAPATPHVVVWPVDPSLLAFAAGESGLSERRHWHTGCWASRR
ncbi:MAG: hypothetical protein M3386_06195 [Actinomycetota bacterium]|nr:hypothetical protein [Actinomycetota bacterium]